MSIASEISRISGNVADAYTAANAKGATMPVSQNSDNLATTISTIPSGTTPTGTKNITTNGTHDVAGYANADVQVPTTAPELYRVFRVDNGKLKNSISTPFLTLPSSVTDVDSNLFSGAYQGTPANVLYGTIDLSSLTSISGANAFNNAFAFCPGITSVDLSGLTTITSLAGNVFANAFQNCTGILSVNLSSLTTVKSAGLYFMLNGCSGLTTLDISSLTTISGANGAGSFIQGCTSLTSLDLSSLTTISGNFGCSGMCGNCTNLTSVNLSSLANIPAAGALNSAFRSCTSLTNLSFPALTSNSFGNNTNQFNFMLQNVTGCTVHFPSNLQSVIGSWTDVVNGFGGTNTTVLFDLPATE